MNPKQAAGYFTLRFADCSTYQFRYAALSELEFHNNKLNSEKYRRRIKHGYIITGTTYGKDALAPYISANTLDFHYGKHHKNLCG